MENRTDNAEPTLARRYDFGGEVMEILRRPDKSIIAKVVAVRTGVNEYVQPNGSIRRELVNLDAVKATAESIGLRPMTLGHPEGGFVNGDDDNATGSVGERVQVIIDEHDAESGYCLVTTIIRRSDAVKAFDAGVRDVSCGYPLTDLLITPGVFGSHGPYDAIQVRGPTDHLAQVDSGRVAGTRIGDPRADGYLRADSTDAAGTYAPPKPAAKTRTDRGSTAMTNPLLMALCSLLEVSRFDSEDAALTEATAKVTKMKADTAALQRRVDEFPPPEEEKEDAPDLVEELKVAKARIAELEAAATKKDEEEEEMKADARLKTLQALATEHDVKHDGLDLPALRLKLAKTRSDSFTADTPVVALDAVIATIPAKKPGRSDARSRYDQSPDSANRANRANRADGGSSSSAQPDPSNTADLYHEPHLARHDAAQTTGS